MNSGSAENRLSQFCSDGSHALSFRSNHGRDNDVTWIQKAVLSIGELKVGSTHAVKNELRHPKHPGFNQRARDFA
jgi:hypothetical protein